MSMPKAPVAKSQGWEGIVKLPTAVGFGVKERRNHSVLCSPAAASFGRYVRMQAAMMRLKGRSPLSQETLSGPIRNAP